MRRAGILLLLAWLGCAVPAPARVGETLAQLKERYGKPAEQTVARKDTAMWLFEVADHGQLLLSVTFNARGVSIAEGLKPLKRAQFTEEDARGFIDLQIAPLRNSPTLHAVPAGNAYTFAGQQLTCGENEAVLVDDARGLLVVWTKGPSPAVLVVTAEMFR